MTLVYKCLQWELIGILVTAQVFVRDEGAVEVMGTTTKVITSVSWNITSTTMVVSPTDKVNLHPQVVDDCYTESTISDHS